MHTIIAFQHFNERKTGTINKERKTQKKTQAVEVTAHLHFKSTNEKEYRRPLQTGHSALLSTFYVLFGLYICICAGLVLVSFFFLAIIAPRVSSVTSDKL